MCASASTFSYNASCKRQFIALFNSNQVDSYTLYTFDIIVIYTASNKCSIYVPVAPLGIKCHNRDTNNLYV